MMQFTSKSQRCTSLHAIAGRQACNYRRSCKCEPHSALAQRTRRSAASRCRSCRLQPKAIGFDLPGTSSSKDASRAAEELLQAKSSLLIFNTVMTTAPAKAFVKLLETIVRGPSTAVAEAYGEFYRSLQAASSTSWKDHVLDQILYARDNALARAASKSGSPSPSDSPLVLAAQHDLVQLQRLAVDDAVIAGYAAGTASWLSFDWEAAASAHGAAAVAHSSDSHNGAGHHGEHADHHKMIMAPPSPAEISHWKTRIDSLDSWRSAVDMLQRYWVRHGHGILSRNGLLSWQDGGFVAETPSALMPETLDYDKIYTASFELAQIAQKSHERGDWGHVTVGRALESDFDVAAVAAIATANQQYPDASFHARMVLVPRKQLINVRDLCWSISQHPRMLFLICLRTQPDNPALGESVLSEITETFLSPNLHRYPHNAVLFYNKKDAALSQWHPIHLEP